MKLKPISETVTSEYDVEVCSECDYLIDQFGECNDGCPMDCEHPNGRPDDKVIVRTWHRTETLIKQHLRSEKIELGSFKKGDIVRYSSGPTALMRLDEPHAGIGWHGSHVLGGVTFAPTGNIKPPSNEDIETWRKHRGNV